jgi:hypothetical protein
MEWHMPQPVPLERGKYYHIYNRGNNREDIFLQERNYAYFLKLYARLRAGSARGMACQSRSTV